LPRNNRPEDTPPNSLNTTFDYNSSRRAYHENKGVTAEAVTPPFLMLSNVAFYSFAKAGFDISAVMAFLTSGIAQCISQIFHKYVQICPYYG
jgi:hypothetical protein